MRSALGLRSASVELVSPLGEDDEFVLLLSLRFIVELDVSVLGEGDVVVVVVVVVLDGLLLVVEVELSVEELVEPVEEPVVAAFAAGCCMLLTLGPLGLLALSGVVPAPAAGWPGPWPPAVAPVPAVPVPAAPVPVSPDWA